MTIELGDYVLASRWSDHDPNDPWRIGFVCQIIHTWNRDSVRYVIGEADGTWSDFRHYQCAKKITKGEGKDWLDKYGNENEIPIEGSACMTNIDEG